MELSSRGCLLCISGIMTVLIPHSMTRYCHSGVDHFLLKQPYYIVELVVPHYEAYLSLPPPYINYKLSYYTDDNIQDF